MCQYKNRVEELEANNAVARTAQAKVHEQLDIAYERLAASHARETELHRKLFDQGNAYARVRAALHKAVILLRNYVWINTDVKEALAALEKVLRAEPLPMHP